MLATIYKASLLGDRSAIPFIIAALRRPASTPPDSAHSINNSQISQINPLYVHTALAAAVRLHATEALPEIKALIKSNDPDASALARVAEARLLADAAVRHVPNPRARTVAEVQHFYHELGSTSAQLNSDLENYNKPPVDENGKPTTYPSENQPVVPLGVYAMREIADMIYQGDYKDYISLPAIVTLRFSGDGPSLLKYQFAKFTKKNRAIALVETLSQRDSHGEYDAQKNYILQLAQGEGPQAAAAAVSKLQQMEASPQQYPEQGFHNLLDLIGSTGTEADAVKLDKLRDTRQFIANHLLFAAGEIRQGRQHTFVDGY